MWNMMVEYAPVVVNSFSSSFLKIFFKIFSFLFFFFVLLTFILKLPAVISGIITKALCTL